MESALLSTSRYLPSQNRELGGLLTTTPSSFCGLKRSLVGRGIDIRRRRGGSSRIVTSVLGRTVKKETVIPDPDYRIPIVLLGFAGGLAYTNNLLPAAPVGLLGLLLLFQTTRVRFVFDQEALLSEFLYQTPAHNPSQGLLETTKPQSVASSSSGDKEVKVGGQLQESGENVFVGGKNRWKYSTFVNWELWWPSFPVLVYFKETQTKPEGQVHFFPVIFNGKQLYDVMVERAGPSKTSSPK